MFTVGAQIIVRSAFAPAEEEPARVAPAGHQLWPPRVLRCAGFTLESSVSVQVTQHAWRRLNCGVPNDQNPGFTKASKSEWDPDHRGRPVTSAKTWACWGGGCSALDQRQGRRVQCGTGVMCSADAS